MPVVPRAHYRGDSSLLNSVGMINQIENEDGGAISLTEREILGCIEDVSTVVLPGLGKC